MSPPDADPLSQSWAGAKLSALQRTWLSEGALHLQQALAPGLAAEVADVIRRLPPTLIHEVAADRAGPIWRCDLVVPDLADPQLPPPLLRLAHAFETRLPQRLSALTGRTLQQPVSRAVSICWLRKGSYLDWTAGPSSTERGVDFYLGLTAGRWPVAWGGQLSVHGVQHPIGWNTLHVVPASTPVALTLLSRQVEAVLLRGRLVEVPGPC